MMDGPKLRERLDALGLSQVAFARLLHVTPRAVTLWLGGERTVPGYVEAYLDLFASISRGKQLLLVDRVMR